MKMKWWRLKFLDIFQIKNAHTLIMVAACLHNFRLMHDNWIEDAPPVQMNRYDEIDNDYEHCNKLKNIANDDAEDAALGFGERRMLAREML